MNEDFVSVTGQENETEEQVIGPEEIAKAGEILQRYKAGKAALDKRKSRTRVMRV